MHYSHLKNVVYVIHNILSIEYDLKRHPHIASRLSKLYSNHSVVGVSEGVSDDFECHLLPKNKIKTIYNPIDKAYIEKQSQQFLPEVAAGYLVHVGKFKLQKDHDTLIRAYAQSGGVCAVSFGWGWF